MAAPERAALRGCSFSCQDIFKFTLVFGLVVIVALVAGFIELRDIQDRIGWTPSNETLNAENILLREKVKTCKNDERDLEKRFQILKEELKTTTDEKNEHKIDATICANSSTNCWWPVFAALISGVLIGVLLLLCCYCCFYCYFQNRYREREVAVYRN